MTEHELAKELTSQRLAASAARRKVLDAEAIVGLHVATLRELAQQSASLLDAIPTDAVKSVSRKLVDGYVTALRAASCLLAGSLGGAAADVVRCALVWAHVESMHDAAPRIVGSDRVHDAEKRLVAACRVLRSAAGFDDRVPGEDRASVA